MNYNYPQYSQPSTKKGSRIKIGLLIVAIGLLGGAIPTLGAVLSFLVLIGAIIVFLGARDLSNTYRKFTTISLILIFIMIVVELYASIKMITTMSSLANMGTIPYSYIIKIIDPFIFYISIAYILLGASLLLISYPIYFKNTRFIPWAIYALSFIIFLAEAYSQMVALNKMYYQNLTIYNVGVFTNASYGLDDGAGIFMFLWAIAIFIAYFYSRRRFPKIIPQFGPSQPMPDQYYAQNQPFESRVPQNAPQNIDQNTTGQANLGLQNGKYCPTCGTLNAPESKFCVRCGSRLQ